MHVFINLCVCFSSSFVAAVLDGPCYTGLFRERTGTGLGPIYFEPFGANSLSRKVIHIYIFTPIVPALYTRTDSNIHLYHKFGLSFCWVILCFLLFAGLPSIIYHQNKLLTINGSTITFRINIPKRMVDPLRTHMWIDSFLWVKKEV